MPTVVDNNRDVGGKTDPDIVWNSMTLIVKVFANQFCNKPSFRISVGGIVFAPLDD